MLLVKAANYHSYSSRRREKKSLIMTITTTVKHSRDWRSKLQSKNSRCEPRTKNPVEPSKKGPRKEIWYEEENPEILLGFFHSSMSSVGCLLIMACPDLMLLQLFFFAPAIFHFRAVTRKIEPQKLLFHIVWKNSKIPALFGFCLQCEVSADLLSERAERSKTKIEN